LELLADFVGDGLVELALSGEKSKPADFKAKAAALVPWYRFMVYIL
jgi:hypothetical protein